MFVNRCQFILELPQSSMTVLYFQCSFAPFKFYNIGKSAIIMLKRPTLSQICACSILFYVSLALICANLCFIVVNLRLIFVFSSQLLSIRKWLLFSMLNLRRPCSNPKMGYFFNF